MILLVHSYPGANAAFARHYPYFFKAQADRIVGIGTDDGGCKFPEGCESTIIGKNCYIDGAVLPQRLLDTLKFGIEQNDPVIVVCEYDTLFFNALPIQRMEHAVAAHHAGGSTWGSKSNSIWHNPWVFFREAAQRFVEVGQEAIDEGICGNKNGVSYGAPEASPDVFVGYCVEKYNIPIQGRVWSQFSRNSLDIPGDLGKAREAYRSGVDVLHGAKSERELSYILS